MKDKDSKKPKQAKIIKLKNTSLKNPLDDLMKDLEQINNSLETHWKEEKAEDSEEDENNSEWIYLNEQKFFFYLNSLYLKYFPLFKKSIY